MLTHAALAELATLDAALVAGARPAARAKARRAAPPRPAPALGIDALMAADGFDFSGLRH